jgi:S-DNA-T family DNA segregation ATPase FtsK/SpoIIIE
MSPKAATKKRGKKEKGSQGAPLLGREQQMDILALGLLALALFLLLSLIPVTLLGERGADWFPSGNAMGEVGTRVRGLLFGAIGAAALLVPVLVALGGLRVGGWLSSNWTVKLTLLFAGLVVLVPVGAFVLVGEGSGGSFGEVLGAGLVGALGPLGTTLLVGVLAVALSVATLSWNPLRTVATAASRSGAALTQAGRAGSTWLAERQARRPAPGPEAPPTTSDEPFARESGEEAAAAQKRAPEPVVAAPPKAAEPAAAEPAAAEPRAAKPPKARASAKMVPEPAPTLDTLLPDIADPRALKGGELPPLDLLTLEEQRDHEGMQRELDRLGQVLLEKLRTFNVQSELGGRTSGPMVTQFEVVPAPGVKVNRIANLDADLALAMKAQSIRIVAPIPGKGAVGVEIPNPEPEVVYLREILEAREYQKARGHMPLALGKDLTGRPYVADLGKMPHVLIAGATGSGKSVCINTIITSLVYRQTPETLRLLMIDPKMVELSAYADLPHLRHQVITDPRDAAGVLKWAVLEMERRYQLLSVNGVRSIGEFNTKLRDGVTLRRFVASGADGDPDRWIYEDGALPYIVVVVDELADLMMTVQAEIEKPLAQLAQKARAIGIHLIVATQRPSVNVITGLIKANFPTRIAFRVASKVDSRTILDQNGAEALLGNGDMLFLPPGASDPVRIQGAFISTEDTDALTGWYRKQADQAGADVMRGTLRDEPDILEQLRELEGDEGGGDGPDEIRGDWDDLFRPAAEICVQHNQGSTSLLQRRLKIGYGRAARIIDQLHEAGVLGPPDGSRPREVLVSLGALDEICGPAAK